MTISQKLTRFRLKINQFTRQNSNIRYWFLVGDVQRFPNLFEPNAQAGLRKNAVPYFSIEAVEKHIWREK